MLSETNQPTGGERQVVERLEAVTDTALAQLSLDELLHELLVRVQRILAADTAAIFLLDGDVLVERAAAGLEEADTRDIRIPSARASSGAWRRRSGRWSSSTSTAPSWRTPCSARAASARCSASPFSSRGGGSACFTWAPSSRATSAGTMRSCSRWWPTGSGSASSTPASTRRS